jgi:hypothetical protein
MGGTKSVEKTRMRTPLRQSMGGNVARRGAETTPSRKTLMSGLFANASARKARRSSPLNDDVPHVVRALANEMSGAAPPPSAAPPTPAPAPALHPADDPARLRLQLQEHQQLNDQVCCLWLQITAAIFIFICETLSKHSTRKRSIV